MKYTISESTKTVTVETTDSGESLTQMQETVRQLVRPIAWDEVKSEAVSLMAPAVVEIDETPDPLEDQFGSILAAE